MAGSDKRKQSLYFPEDMLKEIQAEAARQDRSLSWIVQKAWKIARPKFEQLGILEYENLATDGDIDWSALERPLDTEEAQSYEQNMLEEFHKKHGEAAEQNSAA